MWWMVLVVWMNVGNDAEFVQTNYIPVKSVEACNAYLTELDGSEANELKASYPKNQIIYTSCVFKDTNVAEDFVNGTGVR